jgi:gliding motility-associated-like protein
MNYMRVVANSSSTPDNALGSLIRVTIGAPNSTAPTITSYDYTTFAQRDTFCVGDIAALFFSPYNYFDQSTYMWQCNGINNGNPFVSPSGANSNSLYVQLNAPTTLNFYVQETSYGCPGPWSLAHTIVVLGAPSALVTGPHFFCLGDTNTYQSVFINSTYYSWSAPGGIITDTSNNVIDVTYQNTGVYNITMNAINQCGSATNTYSVTVNPYPTATAGNDTVICSSSPVTLSTVTGTGYQYSWSNGTSTIGSTNTVTVTPTTTTSYILSVTIIGGCVTKDTVTVFVNSLNDTLTSVDAGCSNQEGSASATPTGGTPPYTYLWSDGQTSPTAYGLAPGTYTCVITESSGCSITQTVTVASITNLNADAGISTTITQGQSTMLNGSGGLTYSWAPATNLSCTNCPDPLATPTVTTTYTLTVYDSTGCYQTDTVTIFVELFCGEVFVPNAFSPNDDGQNDVLYCRVDPGCLQSFEFIVFNRWGEAVFRTSDPTIGWDGPQCSHGSRKEHSLMVRRSKTVETYH